MNWYASSSLSFLDFELIPLLRRPKPRDYKTEMSVKSAAKPVSDHPLRPLVVSHTIAKKTKTNRSSPEKIEEIVELKKCSNTWVGLDPLSMALSQQSQSEGLTDSVKEFRSSAKDSQSTNDFIENDFTDWSSMKISILNKYTTSERLSIKTSFLVGGGSSVVTGSTSFVRNSGNTSVSDKVRHRLEQLDDFEEGSVKEMLNLTQTEYVNRIDELNVALRESWESDQRVKALKIAIQCSKLLADVSVIQFYPSKFVLITDILDNFGTLVYKRIYSKAGAMSAAMESARETCRNWFYKIASVRELIPRFYVETAILKVYGFLINENEIEVEFERALKRLTKTIRGIGDPLVSVYARAYLCRTIIQIAPKSKHIFQENFNDFLQSLNQVLL